MLLLNQMLRWDALIDHWWTDGSMHDVFRRNFVHVTLCAETRLFTCNSALQRIHVGAFASDKQRVDSLTAASRRVVSFAIIPLFQRSKARCAGSQRSCRTFEVHFTVRTAARVRSSALRASLVWLQRWQFATALSRDMSLLVAPETRSCLLAARATPAPVVRSASRTPL